MIKNVIFDIGNVLLDFCWKDHIARFGFQGEKADRIAQAMMLGPIWPKLDLGLESDEDILEQFVAHTPELEQEIRLVFSDLSTIVREYEGSVDWIESLKARGYHTYYLSNYGERIRREASKELSFLSHMDGGIRYHRNFQFIDNIFIADISIYRHVPVKIYIFLFLGCDNQTHIFIRCH